MTVSPCHESDGEIDQKEDDDSLAVNTINSEANIK